MYADDHQIYEIGKEMCNLLQGNLQKYQMMTIRRKRARNEQTSITVKGEIITESENLQLRTLAYLLTEDSSLTNTSIAYA